MAGRAAVGGLKSKAEREYVRLWSREAVGAWTKAPMANLEGEQLV